MMRLSDGTTISTIMSSHFGTVPIVTDKVSPPLPQSILYSFLGPQLANVNGGPDLSYNAPLYLRSPLIY